MSKTDCVNCGAPIGPVVTYCPYCNTEYEPIHTYTIDPIPPTGVVVRGCVVHVVNGEINEKQPALIYLGPLKEDI